jgi:hypothetical protein
VLSTLFGAGIGRATITAKIAWVWGDSLLQSTSVIRRGFGAAALVIVLGSALPLGRGQAPTDLPQPALEWSDTEKWVWFELVGVARKIVSLDRHCLDAHPDPKDGKDAGWRNECRTLSPRFLRDLLTRTPWQEAVPYGGVLIDGVWIDGDLDLENAKLVRAVTLVDSRVEGKIILQRARTDSLISLIGTFVAGEFNGNGLQSGSDLLLRSGSTFAQRVALRGAKIGGLVDLSGATVDGQLEGDYLEAHDVFIRSDETHKASFKNVVLRGAQIGGEVSFVGATVEGQLDGDYLEAHDLFMRSDSTTVTATFAGPLYLVFARIGGNLELEGARLGDFDLSGASVDGVFELGTAGGKHTEWRKKDGKPSTLMLRYAHIGDLSDEENAWPAYGHLQIDGLVFSRLGTSMVRRGMEWWDKKWARLDKRFSTTPYTQLSATLLAMGDPEASNEIRYLGRERERDAAWSEDMWGTWLVLTLVWAVAGYAIGIYTFVVLVLVSLFTLAGAAVLWFTVPTVRHQRRSPHWCVGASLSRLLPVIEINKEFTDFFHDPDRTRLNEWQFYTFSALGVIGWVLVGILIAAMSGLTQKP